MFTLIELLKNLEITISFMISNFSKDEGQHFIYTF
jgi:hypothetical protein